ncbi:hypothetical protein N865_15610 [Intrasporangium oryzae NRRL B-24470]|uniref:Uncharacterized protein n=1 Tax=Intrasporangium oryzae NRRL B-24470 TaxID=1386089 RepID=W9G588_9MICO|nr:hypothetical protein [Intrasporangium oryzae]EWT00472.1 hypothetical protein N865_15610 [Intrasporangium oryzae NRRL B-24470]
MTSRPSGIPPSRREARTGPGRSRRDGFGAVAAALGPWRHRLLWLGGLWVAIAVGAAVLGLRPDAPHLLAILLALAAILWYASDHTATHHVTVWPLTDGTLGSGTRGNDFRATSLAARIEAANSRGEGRETLVHDLHVQLSTIIRERLWTKHALVIEEEPKWSQGVMPPELWEFLVTLPPPDLYRPDKLDPILRRIEQW